MSNMAIGIFLGLSGSIAINTGNNLQSLGMYNLEQKAKAMGDHEEQNACKSTLWISGTVVFLSGALLNFSSYGFAPQSTLASLESIQFVTNLFLGKWLLKKEISRRMYFGTFLTVGGTVMAVLFSSREGATIEVILDLILLWEDLVWISYLIFVVVLALILYLTNSFYERKKRAKKESGTTLTKDTQTINEVVVNKNREISKNTLAVIYAVFSALFGTLSVVFAKILADLLELQTYGISIFTHWFTYLTLLSWLILMTYWLMRLNNALRLYNPMVIIPLLQVNFIFFAITSGGIFFQEFNYMEVQQWVLFTIGVALMFLGIYLLVPPEDFQISKKKPQRRRSTINEKQRKLSEYLMTGPSRGNHMEFERRLTDGVLKKTSPGEISLHSYSMAPYVEKNSRSESCENDVSEDSEKVKIVVLERTKHEKEDLIELEDVLERTKPLRVASSKPVLSGDKPAKKKVDYIRAQL